MNESNFILELNLILKENNIFFSKKKGYSSHMEYYFRKDTLKFNEINDLVTRVFLFLKQITYTNQEIIKLDNLLYKISKSKNQKELNDNFIAFKEILLNNGKN